MADLALYRKWRSKNFEELVGQPHITQTLHNAVKSGHIAHAYLFCGPRGTGKTSAAKIFAKALNCERGPIPDPCNECEFCKGIQNGSILDFIEIDAASNRGIDEIRDLREKIKFPPTVCRTKVYIIDEVHMLTPEAFNALLKTLEEPPPQTVFILCTTEPNKLLPTVASRCQRFDFRRISPSAIQRRLSLIAQAEHLEVEPDVFLMLARAAEGSLRDAVSLLDQLRTFCQGKIDKEKTILLLGETPREIFSVLLTTIAERNLKELLIALQQYVNHGGDLPQLIRDLVNEFRKLLLWKIAPEVVEATDEEKESLAQMAPRFQSEELYRVLRLLSDLRNELRHSQHPQISAELVFMRIINLQWEPSLEGLKRRVEILEAGGNALRPESPQQAESRSRESEQSMPRVARPDSHSTNTESSSPQTAPASPGASVTLETIQNEWPKFVERLRASRHNLFPALQESRPLRLEKNALVLSLPYEILKNRLEQKKEEAQSLLKEAFGVSLQVSGEVGPVDHDAFIQEAERVFEVAGDSGV